MLTTVGQSWSEFGCENININHHDQSYAVFHKWNLCLDNTDKSSTQASILWGGGGDMKGASPDLEKGGQFSIKPVSACQN
jgi:hypothetical protein